MKRVHDYADREHLPAVEGFEDGPVDGRGAVLVGAFGSILTKEDPDWERVI